MADATKVTLRLPSEKTDKKEMHGGCNESHSRFAITRDRRKGNGCQMQQKVIPFLPSEKTDEKEMDGGCNESHSLVDVRTLTKRKWMADATEVIPFLLSEKTDKKEMMCGMAAATKVIPCLPSEKTDKKETISSANFAKNSWTRTNRAVRASRSAALSSQSSFPTKLWLPFALLRVALYTFPRTHDSTLTTAILASSSSAKQPVNS